jgi:hypothetical protein
MQNFICSYILSSVEDVRYLQTGFGLDDLIYWHLIHSTRNYRQLQRYRYSQNVQIADANTLGFSVFTLH